MSRDDDKRFVVPPSGGKARGSEPGRLKAELQTMAELQTIFCGAVMMKSAQSLSKGQVSGIELRTGLPYANLISYQRLYSEAVGSHFGIGPERILPCNGATGAIEAVRNHIFKCAGGKQATVLTVSPGYWRARESFEGLGLGVLDIKTEPYGFSISEPVLIESAASLRPNLIYLSLPNNPSGAVFDPEWLIDRLPEETAIALDLTLPSRRLDQRACVRSIIARFEGRRGLFLLGSTSKSHNTAECRIGWCVSASLQEAGELRKENRNVIGIPSILKGIDELEKSASALDLIDQSFERLRNAERDGILEIVRPDRAAESVYTLVRCRLRHQELRSLLSENDIKVMWGSELGLSDEYLRLEMLEPANLKAFVDALLSI